MAQLAVAAAGAAVGSLVGQPQVGWLIGAYIGGRLFGEQQKVEGPRLGDLQVQASTYGSGIPQVFGAMRLAGNVIWARPLIEKRNKESAGKGGGGQTVVSYEYFATFAVAFARGPVDAIRRVWADGKLLVDLSETSIQGRSFRFTNEAASLKPYAPVHIRGSHNGAGDLTITWIRRARFGGEWRDLVDVPLNEASEAYEVDVLDGAGQVVRALTSTTPSVTYTAADQTTDFGAPQAAIDVAVHQVSAVIGRGFAGRATL